MKNLHLYAASIFLLSTVISDVHAVSEAQTVTISVDSESFGIDLSDSQVTAEAEFNSEGAVKIFSGGTITVSPGPMAGSTAYSVTAEATSLSGYSTSNPGNLKVRLDQQVASDLIVSGVEQSAATVLSKAAGGATNNQAIEYTFTAPSTATAGSYGATVTFTVVAG